MQDLEDRRGTARIGVIMIAAAVVMGSLALVPPRDGTVALWLIPFGLFGLLGVGLMRNARVARVLAGLLLIVGVVMTPVSAIRAIAPSVEHASADPQWLLAIANALASTLLISWLCVRGAQTVFGRAPRASTVTARITGGVLAVVAANHLWLASQLGWTWRGGWSARISIEGTSLIGFPGWQVWHIVALVVGLVLLVGPRRVLAPAATALLGLCVVLVPLVCLAVLQPGLFGMELIVLGILLLPLYLAWWLRAALRAS